MTAPRTLILLVLLASTTAAQRVTDSAHRRLHWRALRDVAGAPPAALTGPGNVLFAMNGGDNGECVRAVGDVNGDGLDDIVVGIGQSGTDNVFCLDGASSGTASVLWQVQTNGGVSGGSCYGDQSIVPASDVDGNGLPNVLLATAWGGRTAFDLDTLLGTEQWRYDTYLETDSGWVYSLCEISDVTGDGVPEVAFGTGSFNDRVHLVDGASSGQAAVVWSWYAGDAVYSVRNIGDVNGDGTDDVLAAIGDNVDHLVCLEGDSASPAGNVLWTYAPGQTVFACGVLPDITGDGVNEALAVVWVLGGSAIRCLNGATGALVWFDTSILEYGMMVDTIDDVTGDGKADVVVGSWENAVSVLDGTNGALFWKTTVGTTNGGDVWTARGIDDLDGDGRPDVIAGSFDTHVYALSGATGAVFWAHPTGNRVFSVAPVGDLNGDGRPEVVAGTQDTTSSTVVWVLEGDAGIAPPPHLMNGTPPGTAPPISAP
jgi:outer membrane protein assembly factor BamB